MVIKERRQGVAKKLQNDQKVDNHQDGVDGHFNGKVAEQGPELGIFQGSLPGHQ
jgi:hypothetical protein